MMNDLWKRAIYFYHLNKPDGASLHPVVTLIVYAAIIGAVIVGLALLA